VRGRVARLRLILGQLFRVFPAFWKSLFSIEPIDLPALIELAKETLFDQALDVEIKDIWPRNTLQRGQTVRVQTPHGVLTCTSIGRNLRRQCSLR
jgi:hypothetical protein